MGAENGLVRHVVFQRGDVGQLRTSAGKRRGARWVLAGAVGLAVLAGPAVSGAAVASSGPEVLSWGAGDGGQLGDGGRADRWSPGPVSGLDGGKVKEISAGGTGSDTSFAVARLDDNTVRAWGHNSAGQLGNGSRHDRAVPGVVSGLQGVDDVSAGGAHVLVVSGGRVWAWGENRDGQLGNNRFGDDSASPVRVPGIAMARQVAAGCDFSLALMEDGTVWSWGSGVHGQLGTGERAAQSVPQEVKNVSGVAEIAAGCHHGVARTEDGVVWTWGDNSQGQLGDGSAKTSSSEPVKARWLRDIDHITAGADHTFAIRDNKTVYGWGSNRYGQFLEPETGDDAGRANRNVPVEIEALAGAGEIAAGRSHNLAVFAKKGVVAWGANGQGQLGNGTNADRFTLVTAVTGDLQHVAASLAGNSSYAY
ncbi:sialidase [Streptomyces sp. NPDC051364]|uniref:RCC1 domain-containing protein n=1 Tax=Streptomyces sp. NPDC051364 TaxID=3155799 RepID=UPI003444B94A